ncbi:MAG: DMT family transporter, partial [Hyphomicrobiales bacterium]
GILMAVVPLTVIILAHLALPDEKLNRYKAAGFVIGFAGVVMLMGFDNIANFANQGIAFWAQLMIILATLCYAVHSISARIMPKVGPLEMSAAVMALAGVMMTCVALFTAPQFFTGASTISIASVLALGIFPTALASIVLYFLLTGAGPSFVSYCNYLIPAYAVILGVVVMGEDISSTAIFGLVLILSGIAISRRTPGEKRTPTLRRGG